MNRDNQDRANHETIRDQLKHLFQTGACPDGKDFALLIDNCVSLPCEPMSDHSVPTEPSGIKQQNRTAGLSSDLLAPLKLTSSEKNAEMLVFGHKDSAKDWCFSVSQTSEAGSDLQISQREEQRPILFLTDMGRIGISVAEPKAKLHVSGNVLIDKGQLTLSKENSRIKMLSGGLLIGDMAASNGCAGVFVGSMPEADIGKTPALALYGQHGIAFHSGDKASLASVLIKPSGNVQIGNKTQGQGSLTVHHQGLFKNGVTVEQGLEITDTLTINGRAIDLQKIVAQFAL